MFRSGAQRPGWVQSQQRSEALPWEKLCLEISTVTQNLLSIPGEVAQHVFWTWGRAGMQHVGGLAVLCWNWAADHSEFVHGSVERWWPL